MIDRPCRITVIGTDNQYGSVPGLSATDELNFVNACDEIKAAISKERLGSQDVTFGFVIDAFDVSGMILAIWQKAPESIATRGQELAQNVDTLRNLSEVSAQDRALEILGLAAHCSRSGWPCLIAIDLHAISKDNKSNDLMHKLAATRTLGFRLVAHDSRAEALRNAVTIVNSLQCLGAARFTVAESGNTLPFLCPDIETFLTQWEMEEFEHDDVIRSIECSIGKKEPERQVFLRAATLIRLMATRSFEHHECNARILLTKEETLNELVAAKTLFELFDFCSPPTTWFHRADSWLLESGIETALSESSILAVDRETGRVFGVYELITSSSTRLESLSLLTKDLDFTVVIAAMKSGYVEVYHGNTLLLWYDRYRWRSEPFHGLRKRLKTINVAEAHVQKLLGAISTLMDNKESSILIFPDAALDQAKLEENLREMRAEIQFRAETQVKEHGVQGGTTPCVRAVLRQRGLDELTSFGLASVLRLDGAHVIRVDKITNAAELISLPQRGNDDGNNPPMRQQQGSGRQAAYQLSQAINGFVVKVSSSGELRIFDGHS